MASNDILVTLRADMKDLQKSFKDLQNNLTDTSKQTSGLSSVLSKIGKVAGFTIIGKQVLDLGKNIVETGKNFEAEMSKVQAISGATGDEFETLTNLAKELGSTTNFSASEASQGMQYLAMAGWKTNDIMAGLPAILDLATASGSDLARVSDIASDAMTGFGLQASEAGHFADVLAYASSNANVTVETLGEAFKYVAPLAQSTNQSMETVTSAISKLGDAGIKGSMGGTALRAILNRLATAPKPVAEAMAELNVEIYDQDGKMRNLNSIIGDVATATAGMDDAEKNRINTMIAGTEALSAWNVLLGVGEEGLNSFTNELVNSDGSAKEMSKTMNDNLAGSLKELDSKLESVKIALFEKFKEPLKKVVDGIIEAIDWISKIDEWFKQHETTILAVGGAFGVLALGIGAFTAYLQAGAIIGALTTLGSAIAGVATTVWSLTISFLASPFGWVTMALMALVVAGVYLWKNWETVKAKCEELWGAVKAVFTEVWDSIKTACVDAWNGVKELTINTWTNIKNKTAETWENVKATISEKIQQVKTKVSEIVTAIKDKISTIFNNIKDTISRIWDNIKSTTSSVWESVKNAIMTPVNNIKDRVSTAFSSLKDNVLGVWDGIKSGIAGVINGIIGLVNKMINALNRISFNVPDWVPVMGGKSFGFNIPNIPEVSWHAKGGIFTRPTILGNHGFGEAGKEAILPLHKLPSLIGMDKQQELLDRILAGNAGGTGGGTTINIEHFENNREQDIAQLAKELEYYRQRYNFAKGVR